MIVKPNTEPRFVDEHLPEEMPLRITEENVYDYVRRALLAMAPKAMEVIRAALESRNQAKARRVASVVLELVGKMGEGETSREAKRVLKEWRSRRRSKPILPAPEATPATPQGVE
jgi:cytosine/adenosine deaminase-related metal-dependent hydrolase